MLTMPTLSCRDPYNHHPRCLPQTYEENEDPSDLGPVHRAIPAWACLCYAGRKEQSLHGPTFSLEDRICESLISGTKGGGNHYSLFQMTVLLSMHPGLCA